MIFSQLQHFNQENIRLNQNMGRKSIQNLDNINIQQP
jgi:hypothetical protein